MKKILISAIIAFTAVVGCQKDDTLYNGNITMANIVENTIVSDQGNIFDIVQSAYEVELDKFEHKRVILACDVLKKTADKRYNVRLHNIAPVLTKYPVNSSSVAPDSDIAVDNPIIIRGIWYSGGYINMDIMFVHKSDSKEKHMINLVYEDAVATAEDDAEKNYTFILRHNAFGEIPTTDDDLLDYETSAGFVSFPLAGLIQEDKAKITIKWSAHPYENGRYNYLDQKETSMTYNWKRIGFEQDLATKVPNLTLYRNFLAR